MNIGAHANLYMKIGAHTNLSLNTYIFSYHKYGNEYYNIPHIAISISATLKKLVFELGVNNI